ncbi:CopG family transcriptional regulator [Brachybacterium sp. UMB0905]|uniref:CopG family transcriptional regulator n=1 Tax=Brachybacterium sp. UMB0905 TaxID=2069310 RepID=UPI000C80D002|nr:CopG family transcriptional regulator [Brachybacterium sp. UMB0905]PMC76434.1 CopG family transcriptional regulator [Brachybacterium sp. UMB0905]
MTLQLSAEDERTLACLADADAVTPQEAVIRAIHEAAARRGGDGKVAAASARARERYAEVLERFRETDITH